MPGDLGVPPQDC
nr:hypothetical 1.2K protein - hepatitis C virus [Hepacivirus hominis]